MNGNHSSRLRRIEVFLTRIEGEYPKLLFSVDGAKVPFVRGRLLLGSSMADAQEVEVSVADDSPFVPYPSRVPIAGERVMVRLVPREELAQIQAEEAAATENAPAQPDAASGVDAWEEVPFEEDFEEQEEEGNRRKTAIIWALVIACLIGIGILVWSFFGGKGEQNPVPVDSDTLKHDTVQTDTARPDTARAPEEEAAPAYGGYAPTFSSDYSYSDSSDAPADEPRKRKPAYSDYTTQGEH